MKGQIQHAKTPAEYIAAVEPERKPQISKLNQLIEEATGLKARIVYGMLAYGENTITYADGHTEDWFLIGLASNKQKISLYLANADFKKNTNRIGSASFGKGCVRFTSVDSIDLDVIKEMVQEAAKVDK